MSSLILIGRKFGVAKSTSFSTFVKRIGMYGHIQIAVIPTPLTYFGSRNHQIKPESLQVEVFGI